MSFDYLIRSCRLYHSAGNDNYPVDIGIADGIIAAVDESLEAGSATILDAAGKTVIPGLIDIHIQGAGGADILDGTSEAIKTMSSTLARMGTTGFLATTVMSPGQHDAHIVNAARLTGSDLGGASLLGVHLEGPFINPAKRGGIAPDAIYAPSHERLERIVDLAGPALSMMTIAPELDQSSDIIAALVAHGVIASIGHTAATYEETLKGFSDGITHVTHIFNAMPPLNHREPGPVGAIIETPGITIQLIGDGVHVHESVIRTIQKAFEPSRLALITDGVQAMGLPEGNYRYNGREYESRNGAARYLDDTLIGSTLSLKDVVLRYRSFTGCSFAEAIDRATAVPAAILGLNNRKGSLRIGNDADIVILGRDFSVTATFVNGRLVFRGNI